MDNQLEVLIMFTSYFHLDDAYITKLRSTFPQANITVVKQKDVTLDMLTKAEVIFGWPKKEQVKMAKNLKWLQLPTAGARNFVDKSIYQNEDVIVTNASGVFGLPIAEHVMGMILAFNRNLHTFIRFQQQNKWKQVSTTKDFCDSTVGILGFGDIGTEVAKRSYALGARVLAVKRNIDEKPDYIDQLYDETGVDKLLLEADYLVLALPHTKKTEGIIGAKELNKMKKNAVIINVGRGILINQQDLIKALQEEWIAGAGLDVTTPEPLPEDNPLWELPNVILTPHISNDSPTNQERRFKIFMDNLGLYCENKSLDNQVDFKNGY